MSQLAPLSRRLRRALPTATLLLFTAVVSTSALAVDATDQILVWAAAGAAPGAQSLQSPGQLAFINGAGEITPVMDVPANTRRVFACSNHAQSPNGSHFALYVGGQDEGALYLQTDLAAPVMLDDIQALTCLGNGTLQYSPNSERLGYIAFEAGATSDEFADGVLHVYNTVDQTELIDIDNTLAFDLRDDLLAAVSFFTNDLGEADEAAVIVWDGSSDREVATLVPETEECRFTSAEIAIAGDNQLLLVLGQRCRTNEAGTNWQLYTVDPESGNATRIDTDTQPGAFLPFARSNNVFVSPDDALAYFTVPDGLTANTVALVALNRADGTLNVISERQLVMPTYSTLATYTNATNSAPIFSSDNRWMAAIQTSPNNDNSLYVLDLNTPDTPISIRAGSGTDVVSAMTFTPDNQNVVYIAGSSEAGGDNALQILNLAAGNEERVRRGRYLPVLSLSPDGTQAALLDVQIPEDTTQPDFVNLVTVTLADGAATTLLEGGTVTDGEVTDLQFAYPLVWRRGEIEAAS